MPGGDKVPKKTRKTVRIKHLSLSNSNSNTRKQKQKQKQTLKKPTGKFWNSSSSNSRSNSSSSNSSSSNSSHSRHSRKKLPPTQIQKIKFTGRYWNPVKDLSSRSNSSRSRSSSNSRSSYNVSSVSSVNSAPRKLVQSQRPPHNASAPTPKPTVEIRNNSHKNFRHLKTRKLKTPHRYERKTKP